jgi:hypothetical protein
VSILSQLVVNASGLFIWAARGKWVRSEEAVDDARGQYVYSSIRIPSVYTTVLKSTIREEYLEEEKEDKYSVLKQVLGTVALLYSPLSIDSLPGLLYLLKETIESGFGDLRAL